LLPPGEALGQQDLVDPAPLDRDLPMLVEVGLDPIQGPGGEGEPERAGVGHRGGEDLGDLLGRIGRRPAGSGLIGQGRDPLGVEACDPGVDRGSRDAQVAGDGGDRPALGGGEDDPGPLDQADLVGAGAGQVFEFLPLLIGQLAELDLRLHGVSPGDLLLF
jgi:hypothetical protein